MKNIAIIDTGPIVALFNKRDNYHKQILHFMENYNGKLITTWSVITESMHLLRKSLQAQLNLLEWIKRGGLKIAQIELSDIERMIVLTKKYSDLPMDLADCSLIILAENQDIKDIISIDSDYDIYRTLKKEVINNLLKTNP